jgi:hypothetical protein
MVTVENGVVTVQGNPETAEVGHNLVTRIRQVQGVVVVRDKLVYPPTDRHIAGLYYF